MLPELNAEEIAERRSRLPLRPWPLLYFGFAHLCLLAAALAVAVDPRAIAGFFYHPRMVAVVHLVTLGWISSSILGALYLVLPMAMRVQLARSQLDGWLLILYLIGVVGMVSHFWLDSPTGTLWAAGLLILAFALAAYRFLPVIGRAKAAAAVRLHYHLAFANILLAALLGFAAGINKLEPVLPGGPLGGVLAHAHVAVFGWVVMTVMAAGYRLIPMLLPAAIPEGPAVWLSATLTEAGTLLLPVAILLRPTWLPGAALLIASGLLSFGSQLVWMIRNPRPVPLARPSPDLGILQVAQAFFYLVLAIALGLALALGPPEAWKVRGAMAYGVALLVGFLAQIIVGVGTRIVPWAAYLWAFGDGGFRKTPPSPHDLPHRPLHGLTVALWALAVPMLLVGLTFDLIAVIAAGGWLLAAATGIGGASLGLIVTRARRDC